MSEPDATTRRFVRRYVGGATIREIAAAEEAAGRKISYETVRTRLVEAGVTLRKTRRRHGGRLGAELIADLGARFPEGASIPELVEWLSEDRKAVLVSVSSLLRQGYLAVVLRSGA